MQNEVLDKIDTLIQMCDSTSDINTLQIQYKELEKAISKKEKKLNLLKSSNSDEKYYDESAEIVDKNIEISLNKKIKSLKKSFEDIEMQLNEELEKENELNKDLEQLKKEIDDRSSFLEILKEKLEILPSNDKNNFEKINEETQEKLEKLKKKYDCKRKNYDKIQGKLEVLSFSKSEFVKKIEDESSKLIDVKANLLNKRNYVNGDLKAEDDQKINKLEEELTELKKEKNEISDNPLMISEKAKTYLIDEDYTSALKEVERLKNIILKQPYMDVDSANARENLSIELENAKAKRDEFSSMINSKNYESVDTTLIKDRLSYIKEKKENCIKSIDEIKSKINNMDNNELEDLCNRIKYCENEADTLKEKIDEFKNGINDVDLSSNKKIMLQTSLIKKEEELDNILKLLASYKKDRNSLIINSFNLEKNDISRLEQEVEQINKEIKKLNKLVSSTNKSVDTIAIENDKNYLKELNDNIKAIKKRQKFDKSPNEIYKEIEILLGQGIKFNNIDLINSEKISNDSIGKEIDNIDSENITELKNDSNISEIITVEDLKNNNEEISNYNLNDSDLEQLDILNFNDENDLNENAFRTTEGKVESNELEKNNTNVSNEILENNNYSTENLIKADEIVQPISLDEEIKEEPSTDSLPVINDEELNLNISDLNESEEKLKVINVETLEENKNEEENANNEFLIGDYIS